MSATIILLCLRFVSASLARENGLQRFLEWIFQQVKGEINVVYETCISHFVFFSSLLFLLKYQSNDFNFFRLKLPLQMYVCFDAVSHSSERYSTTKQPKPNTAKMMTMKTEELENGKEWISNKWWTNHVGKRWNEMEKQRPNRSLQREYFPRQFSFNYIFFFFLFRLNLYRHWDKLTWFLSLLLNII